MEFTQQSDISADDINTLSSFSTTTVGIDSNGDDTTCSPVTMLGDGYDPTFAQIASPAYEACSRVLNNDKLLDSIFSFLNMRPVFGSSTSEMVARGSSMDLFRASLACKHFFIPSMRVLWRFMDSWVPLINIISTVIEYGDLYTTDTAIEKSSLDRFFFYSSLVEQFHLNIKTYHSTHRISPHIFLLIHQHSSFGLLPCLKTLVVSEFSLFGVLDELYVLDLMIPQNGRLSQITITDIQSDTEILATSFLQIAHLKSPRLTTLTLHGDDFKGSTVLNTLKYFPNLKTIDLELFSYNSPAVDQRALKGPYFGFLKDLRLKGSVSSTYSILHRLFSNAPLLEKLTISLAPPNLPPTSSWTQTDFPDTSSSAASKVFFKLVDELNQKGRTSLTTLVIESPHHLSELRLDSQQQTLLFSGLPFWKHLKVLSIPLNQLEHGIITATLPCNASLERLTLVTESSHGLLPITRICLFQQMFPNLKFLAISSSLRLDTNHIEQIQKRLSSNETSLDCCRLAELTLLPAAAYHWRLPASGQGRFTFPNVYHPTESIAELFLLSRFLNHVFPHLKKINVEKLYDFVDRLWLDGLEVGVGQFWESSQKGGSKVCPKCHSPW